MLVLVFIGNSTWHVGTLQHVTRARDREMSINTLRGRCVRNAQNQLPPDLSLRLGMDGMVKRVNVVVKRV